MLDTTDLFAYWADMQSKFAFRCAHGSIQVAHDEQCYLIRVQRKLGRKLTQEEAYNLTAQYSANGPSTLRFIDRNSIPF